MHFRYLNMHFYIQNKLKCPQIAPKLSPSSQEHQIKYIHLSRTSSWISKKNPQLIQLEPHKNSSMELKVFGLKPGRHYTVNKVRKGRPILNIFAQYRCRFDKREHDSLKYKLKQQKAPSKKVSLGRADNISRLGQQKSKIFVVKFERRFVLNDIQSNMYLSKAFRSVNLYEDSSEPVINHCEGRTQLKNFFKNESNKESPLESPENNVYIDQQPLYCEEVDHQIEEVGIMAVKEVRYVTEREWQKMVEQQADENKIWEYLEDRYKAESKQRMVSERRRNSKGQFQRNEREGRKRKGIGKRGRPRKVE